MRVPRVAVRGMAVGADRLQGGCKRLRGRVQLQRLAWAMVEGLGHFAHGGMAEPLNRDHLGKYAHTSPLGVRSSPAATMHTDRHT